MANENRATYRYTADEQREMEILRIRYPCEISEEEIRAIDRDVTRRATLRAIILGAAGTLVFGAGLSMVLAWKWMVPGIVIGCCGIAVMASMPAVYERLLRRERRKAAAEIQDKGKTE